MVLLYHLHILEVQRTVKGLWDFLKTTWTPKSLPNTCNMKLNTLRHIFLETEHAQTLFFFFRCWGVNDPEFRLIQWAGGLFYYFYQNTPKFVICQSEWGVFMNVTRILSVFLWEHEYAQHKHGIMVNDLPYNLGEIIYIYMFVFFDQFNTLQQYQDNTDNCDTWLVRVLNFHNVTYLLSAFGL